MSNQTSDANNNTELSITCNMCTTNCQMTAKYVDGKPYVSGSRCPRGDKFGAQKLIKASEG